MNTNQEDVIEFSICQTTSDFWHFCQKKKKKVQLQRKNEPDDNKGGWKNVNNLSKKIFSDTNLLLQG